MAPKIVFALNATIRTPYKVENWKRALREAGISSEFEHVVDGLRHGFLVGMPSVKRTQAPPNNPSAHEHREHFAKIIKSELAAGRYIGPLTPEAMEAFLGPFQTSPISIIPKSTPGKFRLVQNFSHPRQTSSTLPNDSINSAIDSNDFPCTWGTFRAMSILISALPPGSQIAVRDVSEAFRSIPLHPCQWPAAVVRGLGEDLYADICACFGCSSSGGVYGMVSDCACEIFRSRGIGPITKWVDDHPLIRVLRKYLHEFNSVRRTWQREIEETGRHVSGGRVWYGGREMADGGVFEMFEDCKFPLQDLSQSSPRSEDDQQYSYAFQDIDHTSSELGIVWGLSKDVPFSSSGPYMGFVWHLAEREVELPREKADKYAGAIRDWTQHETHTLDSIQKLYGKLLHAALVIPAGRARLTGLERALALGYPRPFLPRHPPKSVPSDLRWWLERLQRPSIRRSIFVPQQLIDLGAFSDASTGVGIGIVVGGEWRAWKLKAGWKTRGGSKDIGWAEAVGFLLLVIAVTRVVPRGTHIRLYGDNKGVVDAWRSFRSRNSAVNNIFKLVHDYIELHGFEGCIHPTWVPSDDNPADAPSRGVYPPTSCLLPPIPFPHCLTPFITDPHSSELPVGPAAQPPALDESGEWSLEEEAEYDPPSASRELAYIDDAIRTAP